jgi:hypothetical protein
MKPTHILSLLLTALVLAACGAPAGPAVPAATATLVPPTPAGLPPSPVASATPGVPPAAAGGLPVGTVALYAAGEWESLEFYALADDGTATRLGRQVKPNAVASPGGRWLACFDSAQAPGSLVVRSLEDGRTHTAALEWPGAAVVTAPAFDLGETRLAFVEVGPIGREGVAWAIVVVNLEDGAVRRYQTTQPLAQPALLPGSALGWSAEGELLLNTFAPYSDSAHQGLWALALPESGAPEVEALPRRQVLAGGAYMWPQLSPDGRRILYLARDGSYTPADYQTDYVDVAVNQLWSLELASGQATLLAEVTDGGALGPAAWSPDGGEVLFVRGRYSGGDRLGSLVMQTCAAGGGSARELGPLVLPAEGFVWLLRWPRPGLALVLVSLPGAAMELYSVELAGGSTTPVAAAPYIHLLGCVP